MNRPPVVAALAVTSVLLLTACAPESAPEGAAAAASATPTLSATPSFHVGTTVDVATAEELNSNPEGQYRGYAMPDGSNIVVDKSAPLPEAVQQDMNRKGNESQQFSSPEQARNPASQAERQRVANEIAEQTGKTVIFVRRLPGFDYDGNAIVNYVPQGGGLGTDGVIRSRSEAEDLVAQKISSNPDAFAVVWPD